MKTQELISIVLDVNEKFNAHNDGGEPSIYYDVLHASLAGVVKSFSKDVFEKEVPISIRNTIKRLQLKILKYASKEYLTEREQEKELEVRKQEANINQPNGNTIAKKEKNHIGFDLSL